MSRELPLRRSTQTGAAGVTRVLAVLAVAGLALLVGSPSFSASPPDNLHSAELVATHFIDGFEGFSYREPLDDRELARLATPALAARLRSSPQAAPGPELTAERFVATARVSGFAVENSTASGVRLLARTTEHLSTTHGSTTTVRLVPVSLSLTGAGWRVARHQWDPRLESPGGGPTSGSACWTTGGRFDHFSGGGHGLGSATRRRHSDGLSDLDAGRGRGRMPRSALGNPGRHRQGGIRLRSVHAARGGFGFEPGGSGRPDAVRTGDLPAYATVGPGGADPASPYDAEDAVYSAARLLCADGGGTPGLLDAAIFAYNHSDAYVAMVLAYASAYEQGGGTAVELTSASGVEPRHRSRLGGRG